MVGGPDASCCYRAHTHLIGIEGGLTTSPLPHPPTFGSRIRRFGRFSILAYAKVLVCRSPRPYNARSGLLQCKRPITGLYDRSGLRRALGTPTMPSAASSTVVSADYSGLSPFPWHATSLGTAEASRGKRSSRRCRGARFIKHSPSVDGGLHGRVPARPDWTTPCIGFLSVAPPLRATRPSDPTSR
jgi:hypothetical protein